MLFILAYLIGSIPFGLLIVKMSGLGDIRNTGSGNIGATNVLRTGNKALALATLVFDGGKGIILIIVLNYLTPYDPKLNSAPESLFIAEDILIGLGAIIGHCFPVWLKFKGGKGVATSLGVLLAAVPLAGLAACGAWLLSFIIFRISSLAALIALATAPIVTLFIYGAPPAIICAIITALVWLRHKDNIKRLMAGTEPRIGKKKGNESQSR